jgi:hypothetical protein
VIDLRSANMVDIAGIHWQVARATSLQQIFFFQSNAAGKSHMGICKYFHSPSTSLQLDVRFRGLLHRFYPFQTVSVA